MRVDVTIVYDFTLSQYKGHILVFIVGFDIEALGIDIEAFLDFRLLIIYQPVGYQVGQPVIVE